MNLPRQGYQLPMTVSGTRRPDSRNSRAPRAGACGARPAVGGRHLHALGAARPAAAEQPTISSPRCSRLLRSRRTWRSTSCFGRRGISPSTPSWPSWCTTRSASPASGAPGRRLLVAWLLAALYAASDEWHQSFVPGHSPAVTDVVIDTCGALTGLLVWRRVGRWWRGRRGTRPTASAAASRRAPGSGTARLRAAPSPRPRAYFAVCRWTPSQSAAG